MKLFALFMEYLTVMAAAFLACLALLLAIGGQLAASLNALYAALATGLIASAVIIWRAPS
jgi:hypothetical protein